ERDGTPLTRVTGEIGTLEGCGPIEGSPQILFAESAKQALQLIEELLLTSALTLCGKFGWKHYRDHHQEEQGLAHASFHHTGTNSHKGLENPPRKSLGHGVV